MANTREYNSSMSAPQGGNATLNIINSNSHIDYNPFGPDMTVYTAILDIIINGTHHKYEPFGSDVTVTIPSAVSVFIDVPAALDAISITQYDDGSDGQEKYLKCMELLGDGKLPVCTARQAGPAGTHGAFGMLSHITDSCELCFYFPTFNNLTASMILKLTSAGMWYKVE